MLNLEIEVKYEVSEIGIIAINKFIKDNFKPLQEKVLLNIVDDYYRINNQPLRHRYSTLYEWNELTWKAKTHSDNIVRQEINLQLSDSDPISISNVTTMIERLGGEFDFQLFKEYAHIYELDDVTLSLYTAQTYSSLYIAQTHSSRPYLFFEIEVKNNKVESVTQAEELLMSYQEKFSNIIPLKCVFHESIIELFSNYPT